MRYLLRLTPATSVEDCASPSTSYARVLDPHHKQRAHNALLPLAPDLQGTAPASQLASTG